MSKSVIAPVKLNPVGSSRTGGIIPSDAGPIRDVSTWARELEPRQTPILTKVGYGSPVNQLKHEVGQSYHTPISGTLGGAVANSDTSLTLTSGQGNYLQKYMVIEVIDWVSGSNSTRLDYTTREEVIVTTLNADTPTVIRDVKNRTDASTPSSGSWPTHSSGAYWGVCGIAMPFNTDFSLSPVTSGDVIFNYPQRFFGMVGADMAARNTPTYEHPTDRMLYELEKQTKLQKHFLERALVSGIRMEGDGSTLPYKMGGIDYFIQTYGNNVNLSGIKISAYDIDDLLRDQYKKLDNGSSLTALMGPDTAAVWDSLLNPERLATVSDTKLNLQLTEIDMRWGKVTIEATKHLPEGTILFVDWGLMKVRPYKGLDWQTKQISTAGPYDQTAIFGQFTLHIEQVAKMGRISNFNTDLSQYPRKGYF